MVVISFIRKVVLHCRLLHCPAAITAIAIIAVIFIVGNVDVDDQ